MEKKKIIEEESIEHLITVLSFFLEEPMDAVRYNQACDYVHSWVLYRLPKKLNKKK